jgi:hypothetical protein
MFLVKNTINLRSLATFFAIFGLAIIVLLSSAGIANAQVQSPRKLDFVGDVKTDWATVRAPAGGNIQWKITQNPAPAAPGSAFQRIFDFGASDTDAILPGDYAGTAKTDPTVFRDPTGTWYVGNFPTGTGGVTLQRTVVFGTATDNLNVGDYDGDGKHDFTIVRIVSGDPTLYWYIMSSGTNTVRVVRFGSTTSFPSGTGPAALFPGADFNGDGRDEFVLLIRNASGSIVTYYIGDSVTGAAVITRSFGNYNTDISFGPEDYTGDGRADFVAVRQFDGSIATWYIGNSQNTTVTATKFGLADPTFTDLDVPVSGDFDGDNIHDICVFRDSNATFYYIGSATGAVNGQQHGTPGDFPLGSFAQY